MILAFDFSNEVFMVLDMSVVVEHCQHHYVGKYMDSLAFASKGRSYDEASTLYDIYVMISLDVHS